MSTFRPYSKEQSARKGKGKLPKEKVRKKTSRNSTIEPKYPALNEERMQKYIFNYTFGSSGTSSAAFICFNQYWFKDWESDCLIIYRNGQTSEIEIKCSIQDFANDFKKEEKHKRFRLGVGERPNQFYYAVPLGKKPMINPDDPRLPDYAGLMGIREDGSYKRLKSAPLQHNEQIDESFWKSTAITLAETINFKTMKSLSVRK